MKILLLASVLCLPPLTAAAEEPCPGGPQADSCGPAGVELPFTQGPARRVSFGTGPSGGPSAPAETPAVRAPAKKTAARPKAAAPLPAAAETDKKLVLFYTYDCPHCREAIEWLPSLEKDYPGLAVEKYEVKRAAANRARLAGALADRGVKLSGFPVFIAGDRVLTGFSAAREPEIRAALDGLYGRTACGCPGAKDISVPFLGSVDPSSVPLLQFSFALGLLDGLNPCAMWVLMFLMGLLVYTRSAKRMLLIGGIFTLSSALVYFSFMAAWFNLFMVIGHARWITAGLGAAAAVMGLINIKEVFFFKKGVSLMIADGAKIKLAEKIRRIIGEHGTGAMIGGTVLLAVFVNLIELGCTIGLPAIFTRVLAVRQAGLLEKYWYMAVYNAAYVIPLCLIISLFIFTMGRYRMTEKHGKVLKGISGALMLALGLLMIFSPESLMVN